MQQLAGKQEFICLVASNKMSMAICMDQLCTHWMDCCKSWYWGLSIIVEKSIEYYIETKILGTLQEDEKVGICILFNSTKCSVAW